MAGTRRAIFHAVVDRPGTLVSTSTVILTIARFTTNWRVSFRHARRA
jgi:hypothetical protein